MTDNRNATDNRSAESAGEARPTTVAVAQSQHNRLLAADSTVSREATGRQRSQDQFPSQTSLATFSARILSIPHADHRYPTVGDWQFLASNGVTIDVQVSATTDWRHAALIAVHELIEAILCRHRGISQDEVDSFDLAHPELAEPGLSENCPYRREHLHAHHVEVNLAYELGVDWQEYTAALESLDD